MFIRRIWFFIHAMDISMCNLTFFIIMVLQDEGDPNETAEEAAARKKLKADKTASVAAKKKGNEFYSQKVKDAQTFPPRELI